MGLLAPQLLASPSTIRSFIVGSTSTDDKQKSMEPFNIQSNKFTTHNQWRTIDQLPYSIMHPSTSNDANVAPTLKMLNKIRSHRRSFSTRNAEHKLITHLSTSTSNLIATQPQQQQYNDKESFKNSLNDNSAGLLKMKSQNSREYDEQNNNNFWPRQRAATIGTIIELRTTTIPSIPIDNSNNDVASTIIPNLTTVNDSQQAAFSVGIYAVADDTPIEDATNTANTTHAAAGLAVFMFSLTGVIFLFLLFYLLSRLFGNHMESFESSKCGILNGNATNGRKFNLLARHFASVPHAVLYPKRIYELQAEEGCLTLALPFSLDALTMPTETRSILLNSSGYKEQQCWMTTSLLEEENATKKKLSTASMKSMAAAPPAIKAVALNCGRTIARKLTGADYSVTKDKLERLHRLRNESFSNSS